MTITLPVWFAVIVWLLLMLFMGLAYYHASLVIHLRKQVEDDQPNRPEHSPALKPSTLSGILS